MTKLYQACALVLLMSLSLAPDASAQERILSFASDIAIAADASMVVTETITVRSAGQQIQRGIYRDFPTRYTDQLGNRYQVGFELLEVLRDGKAEPSRIEQRGNGLRIYVGSAQVMLPPDDYTYTLIYRTTRQLGFFADHDELYWNVTGNGWGFAIDQASAQVTLPVAVPVAQLQMEGYTGVQGSAGQDYEAGTSVGAGQITSTRILRPAEGLTLVLSFPKGIIAAPSRAQQLQYLLKDNAGILMALLSFAGSLGYLVWAWNKVGRDPQRGIIIPRYEAPEGYSPGACRYIWRMGYDTKCFSAAIISLAVKGYLTMENTEGTYTLHQASSQTPLTAGEQSLLAGLFEGGPHLALIQANRARIKRAEHLHDYALRKHYRKEYFSINALFVLPTLLVSAAAFMGLLVARLMVPLAAVVFALTLILHLFFFSWMRAPSRKGRLLLDKLEGLKQFLEVSEKDELNLRHPPELTPALFEAFLPFAMALNVEQRWGERFTEVFKQHEASGHAYRPLWYAGAFHAAQVGSFSQGLGSNLVSAIASASQPPGGSAGHGGGGFSGGGGGGGGGGGW